MQRKSQHPIRKAYHKWAEGKGYRDGSLRAFAFFLGYTDTDSLYRMMRGEYTPPVVRARKLAKILGTSTGAFIDACERANRRRAA